jgi:hypothetical protein
MQYLKVLFPTYNNINDILHWYEVYMLYDSFILDLQTDIFVLLNKYI